MGILHSVMRKEFRTPLLGAIYILSVWLTKDPEQESPTFTALRNRLWGKDDSREGDSGEEEYLREEEYWGGGWEEGEGEGDSGEPAPPFFDIAEIAERVNKFLQTSMTSSHKLSPAVWPTEKEFNNAKEKFGYTRGNLHFAVTGNAGSGKSSLVNAFRGLRAKDPGAAKPGVNETTKKVGRYPHPDKKSPLARIVWYDIPGAGTQNTPGGSAYFNSQGLFIFDFIIVVTGDRLTEQDWDILANCKMYNIPSFVVRSKADVHIQGVMRDESCSYGDARKRYIDETRGYFKEQLSIAAGRFELDCNKEIFLVSDENLRDFIRSLMDGKALKSAETMIDERSLVIKILLVTQMRRYPSKYRVGWVLLKISEPKYVFPDRREKKEENDGYGSPYFPYHEK